MENAFYSFESEDSVASCAMGASILGFGGNHRRLLKEAVFVRSNMDCCTRRCGKKNVSLV